MKRPWNLFFGVSGGLFCALLLAIVFVHIRYVRAESVYQEHLNAVVFRPHVRATNALTPYADRATGWLHWQIILAFATAITGCILVAIIVRNKSNRSLKNQIDP